MNNKLWVVGGLLAASFWFGCDDPKKQKNFKQSDSTLQADAHKNQQEAEALLAAVTPLGVEVLTGDAVALLRDSLTTSEESYSENGGETESTPTNLAEQYKNGELVLPELVEALRYGDEDQRRELLASLDSWYAPAGLPQPAASLVEAVAQNLATASDTLIESHAIGVLVSLKPPGYVAVLEDRLLSGQTLNQALLVQQLGQVAPPDRTFGHITDQLMGRKFREEDMYQVASGLRGFAENGDAAAQAQVAGLCLRYLQQLWGNDYADTTETRSYHLVDLVATYGGRETLPLFRKLLTDPHHNLTALGALVRLEGRQHQKTLLAFLRNENHFFGALNLLEEFPAHQWDNRLGHYVLGQFALHANQYDYQVEQVAQVLWSLGQRTSLNQAEQLLNNPKLGRQLRRYVAFNSASLDEMARSLYDLGLVATPISAAALAQARKDGTRGSQALFELLAGTGRFQYAIDSEEYSTYTEFFAGVAKLADRLLPGAELGVTYRDMSSNTDEETTQQYSLGLIYQQKGYRISLAAGEYPDERSMVSLLNFVLADQGRPERYVPVGMGSYPSGYLLGDEARIGLFKEKFGLDGGRNLLTKQIYLTNK
jgi:hypothetical protein